MERSDLQPRNLFAAGEQQRDRNSSGQHETITMEMANHQGPCPPEGVAPIPEAVYDRIIALWPEFNFQPYATRAQNTECLPVP